MEWDSSTSQSYKLICKSSEVIRRGEVGCEFASASVLPQFRTKNKNIFAEVYLISQYIISDTKMYY